MARASHSTARSCCLAWSASNPIRWKVSAWLESSARPAHNTSGRRDSVRPAYGQGRHHGVRQACARPSREIWSGVGRLPGVRGGSSAHFKWPSCEICRSFRAVNKAIWPKSASAARPAPDRARRRSRGFRSAGTAAPSDTRGCRRDRAASENPAYGQQNPGRASKRAGEMGDAGVHRDHEIEAANKAAVSAKSVRWAVRSTMSVRSRKQRLVVGPRILLQADEGRIDVENARQHAQRQSSGCDRCLWAGLPDQTRPTRNLSCGPRRSSQAWTRASAGGGR